MTTPPSGGPPVPISPRAPLDRGALERVLARAAELQAHATTDAGGALSDDQIIELGREVGIAPDALRQAIAEERGRTVVPAGGGILGQWFGANAFAASRVVPGTPASVLAAVDGILHGELPFEIKRRFPDRVVWEPRRSFLHAMRLQLSRAPEGADVRLAEEVAARVIAVDAQRTHVRLDATLAGARSRAATGSAVTVAAAGAAGFALATAVTPFVLLPVLGAFASVFVLGFRRGYVSEATRVHTALEQLLDRLEYGPTRRKAGVLDKLLG